MALAAKWGITEYPSPAGGCLLTDPGYSRRLKDLFEHTPEVSVHGLHLLKFGRHMRLNADTKIVVGRTKSDNDQIMNYVDRSHDTVIKTSGYPGPTVVLPGLGSKEIIFLAGAICAGYSKAPVDAPAKVQVTRTGKTETVTVLPIEPKDAARFLIQ